MRAWLAIGAMTLLAATASSSLFAQGYPLPASSSEPNVICNAQPACSGSLGLPLWPYSPPLKDHAGRYLDSAYTKDWQAGGRTVRADMIRINEAKGRLYLGMGTRFGAYDLNSFFANLGGPLARAPRGEDYMRPQSDVYPEDRGSGWQTRIMDAQEFLGDYDFDDRGYVYLPYSVWGWGIVQDSGSLSAPLFQDFYPEANPAKLLVLKGTGGRYYVVTSNGSRIQAYDATNPSSTKSLRVISQSVADWAKLRIGGIDLVAITSRTGDLSIYTADALASGGAPGTTLKGYYFVTSSDDAFYAIRRGSASSPATGIAEIRGGASPSSYMATDYSIEGGLYPSFLQYGAGHLTSSGGTGSGDLRVWKIVNGGLQRIDFFDYFRNHYTVPPAGYAKPDNYTQLVRHALVHEHKGKLYLIVSYDGIGDVYELQGRDQISVSLDAGRGYGTGNVFSPTVGDGPFYGDQLPFKSSFPTAALSTVLWNFDNAEAGTDATPTLPIGSTRYQYRGLTTATQITRTRTVTARDPLDSTNTDDLALNLMVPQARVGVKKPNAAAVTLVSENATQEVAVGEQFVDASDGVVQGHVSSWQGTFGDKSLAPNEPYTVQGCGAGSLSLTPYYGPYSGTSPNLASLDNNPFSPGTVTVSYDAKPYVAALTLSSASAMAPVVFSNATRIFPDATNADGSPFFAAAANTLWDVKWEMLPASGETGADLPIVKQNRVAIGTAGDANSWSLDRTYIKSGRKVRLTLTMTADAVAGCDANSLVQTFEYTLELPKPAIEISGCDTVGAACAVSAVPQTGSTSNGWSSYRWTVNGTARSSAQTFDPAFNAAGSYKIDLTVSNALGETTVSKTVTVGEQLCGGKPHLVAFTWNGDKGCSPAQNCSIGERITFAPTQLGYTYQDCDTFAWNFGDGTTSTEKQPVKTYSSNGTRRVTMTVTNSSGSDSFSYDVIVGASEPPPPPPPDCPVPSVVYPDFSGASSGCSPIATNTPCRTSESIRLSVTGGLGETISSCTTVSWSLGDGRTANGRTPSISYTTPGTYTVSATIRGSGGASRTGNVVIKVEGGSTPACPIAAPTAFPTVTYSGPSSGCSSNDDISNCNRNEAVQLSVFPMNYTLQSCDVVIWSFDDGSAPLETSTTTTSHVFLGAKDMYRVTARIKNSKGGSSEGTVNVVFQRLPAEQAPKNAQIAGPTNIRTGQEVQFSGSAEGTVTRWSWNFGDGTSSNQQNPSKTWNTPGTYTVSLSAENSGGASIASQQVVVSDGTAFRYLLPAVARDGGKNNTVWRSDWLLFNPDPAFDPSKPLEIELEFRESTQTIKKTFVMDSSTKVIEDIVKTVFDLEIGRGNVIISGVGEAVPQMWTRTYTVSASGVGTYGQLIPAVPLDTTGESTTVEGSYLIAGVRSTSRFRTNIGVVNPNASSIDVTITASDQDLGLPLGATQITVPAYGLVQLSDLPKRITQIPNDKPYSLMLEAAGGKPLIAYGSMLDNVSQDPVYIEAVPQQHLRSETRSVQILPGIGRVNSWNSDVTLFNADDKTIQVDLIFKYPVQENGSTVIKTSEAKDVALFANTFVQLDDIIADAHPVGQLQPVPEGNASGILTIRTKSTGVNRYPLLFGRTFNNQGEAGTYGQGITAFPLDEPNVTSESPAYVPGVRQDPKYYTNLGIVAVDDRPTRVKVTLLDSITGEATAHREYDLMPYQSIIIPRVLENIGSMASSGSLRIEVTAGGRAWAFASVVDQTTADPEYVPAISLQQ